MTTNIIPTPEQINALSPTEYKVLENRLRRAAERQGFRLEKSRARDPRAVGFGTYQLVNARTNALEAWGSQGGYGLDADDVARFLFEEIPVHVDYAPRDGLTFDDTNGEAILSFSTNRSVRGSHGPDGWVVYYHPEDGGQHLIGGDIGDVDWAVASAKEHLRGLMFNGDD